MLRKILVLSLVLVMALPFVACDGEDLPSAQEIIDASIEALEDVSSYEFEMHGGFEMGAEGGGESIDMTVDLTFDGALDFDNEQMRMEIAMSADMGGAPPFEDEMDIAMEAYVVDGIGYIMTEEPETGRVWEKEPVSEADWEEAAEMLNLSEIQATFVETTEVEVIGSERVGGVDCYVLQVTPDIEQLWETAMMEEVPGFDGEMDMLELMEGFPEGIFEDLSVKEWVAKDTYYIMKVEVELDTELSAEDMGYPGEEGTMTLEANFTALIFDYNEPVSVELPAEAEAL